MFVEDLIKEEWAQYGVVWKHASGESLLDEDLVAVLEAGWLWKDGHWELTVGDLTKERTTDEVLVDMGRLLRPSDMTPPEMLMRLSLAEADIQFARSKCCQAELAEKIGLGDPEREMAMAKEAADRAATHLEELLGIRRRDD